MVDVNQLEGYLYAPGAKPSPARDVPRVDPLTADVEALAKLLCATEPAGDYQWERLTPALQVLYREHARNLVRRFSELEDCLADLLTRAGRF